MAVFPSHELLLMGLFRVVFFLPLVLLHIIDIFKAIRHETPIVFADNNKIACSLETVSFALHLHLCTET